MKERMNHRLLACLLTLAMVLTMLPVSALAEELPTVPGDVSTVVETSETPGVSDNSSLITAFAGLDRTAYEVELNGEAPALPRIVSATVDGAEGTEVSVVWTSEPEFNATMAGTYTFTTSAEGYTLDEATEGLAWPAVTVTVKETAGSAIPEDRAADEPVLPAAVPIVAPTEDIYGDGAKREMLTNGNFATATGELGWKGIANNNAALTAVDINAYTSYGNAAAPMPAGMTESGNVLELNGQSGNYSETIYQRVPVLPGSTVDISFLYAKRQNASITGESMLLSVIPASFNDETTAVAESALTRQKFVDGALKGDHAPSKTGDAAIAADTGVITPAATWSYISASYTVPQNVYEIYVGFHGVGPEGTQDAQGMGNILAYASVRTPLLENAYVATPDGTHDGSDTKGGGTAAAPFATIGKAYEWLRNGGTIHVMEDLRMSAVVVFNENKHFTLQSDTNGNTCTLYRASGNNNASALLAVKKGEATLKQITLDGSEGTQTRGALVSVGSHGSTSSECKVTLSEGVTLQNNTPTDGNSSTSEDSHGGGLLVTGGGTALVGTGVTIKNNTAQIGGGIYCRNGGTLIMTGGTVTGNQCFNGMQGVFGGGIALMTGGSITMSGNVSVIENTYKLTDPSNNETVMSNDLNLATGQTITVGDDGMGTNAKVYICTQQMPDDGTTTSPNVGVGDVKFAKSASANDATHFFSDNAAYAGVLHCKGPEDPEDSVHTGHESNTLWLSIKARTKPVAALDPDTLEGSVTVNPASSDRKYAVVDENGASISGVKAYDKNGDEITKDANGWYHTDTGAITFKPIPAGTSAKVVSIDKENTQNKPTDEAISGPGQGDEFHVPTVTPGQLSGEVRADGADEDETPDAYIHIKPTNPELSYAVVDPTTGKVVGEANGWKNSASGGQLDFGPLDPGTKYEVVAVPKNQANKPTTDMTGKGTEITTPGVTGSTDANPSNSLVPPQDILREHVTPADPATDKLTIAGEKTSTAQDYAVVDPVTGEVLEDEHGDPIWKTGTATDGNDLVFTGLEPDKKYEVVTRPHVTDGSIPVEARPGTTVEKVGVLKATGRVLWDKDSTPVPNATVKVTVPTLDDGYMNLTAKSDADGYYTFEAENIKLPGEFTVYADGNHIGKGVYTQKDNFLSTQPQTLKDIRIYVAAGAPNSNITGGAVSDHGKPIGGTGDGDPSIVVRDKATGEIKTFPGTSKPNVNGGYTAGNFPDGTYTLEYTTAGGKTGMTEIKVEGNKVIPNEVGGYKNTNIPVSEGGIVKGKVDGLGAGETAKVSLNVPVYDKDGTVIGTKTVTGVAEGPGGYWQIAGVPAGVYPVTVETPKGTLTGKVTVGSAGAVSGAEEGEGTLDGSMRTGGIGAESSVTNAGLLIQVPGSKPTKPNVITGVVVDKDNKPMVGATVDIYNAEGVKVNEAPIPTGEGGGYVFPNDLPAGKYWVSADKEGKNGLAGPIELMSDGATKGKTAVTLSPAASQLLEGAVTKKDGSKAAGATVTVKDSGGNVIASVKTDSNGQYYVGSVPAGSTVSIVTPDGESADFTVADSKNNQTGADSADKVWDGDAKTEKADNAKAIIGPNGAKLPSQIGAANAEKAGIAIKGPNGAATDAASKFEINGNGDLVAKGDPDKPDPGTYTVTITDTNGMKVTQTITVNADGKIADSNPITIKPHTVSGTVKYDKGTIPADATISVPGWGEAKVNTSTGAYELSGIPDGEYEALVKVTDSAKGVAPGTTSTVKVTLKVENGVPTITQKTAATTGANVTTSGTNLTVTPTNAVQTITGTLTAAQTAVNEAKTDAAKLGAAITAVKAAQDAIAGATEEELKQLDKAAAQKLADDLTKLMEGQLTVTAGAEGMSNAAAAQTALGVQKGMLVDEAALNAAKETGKTVEVSLVLQAEDVTAEPPYTVIMDQPKVETVASAVSAKEVALFEIVVKKTTTVYEESAEGGKVEVDKTTDNVSKLPNEVEIILSIPSDLRGFAYYSVLRVHDHGDAVRIPSTANTANNTVAFKSAFYSTYAILASDDPMFDDDVKAGSDNHQGGDTGTTGGGGASTTVKVEKTDDGKVKVDKPSAGAGQTVIITVTPDPGFELDSLVVTDKKGNELALKDLGNGKYSFVMPKDKPVTVTATFKPTGATGDPNTNGVAKLLIVEDHIRYMQGDDLGNFRPTGNITRAETAQMFYNLLKEKNVTGSKTFSDVSAGAWYAAAVNALANLGIVEGVGADAYEPDRAITRAEFVSVAMRFATHVTGEKRFTDVGEDYWAHDYITGAAYYGWINGYEDGTFKPANPIARAEAATVVNNMLAREGDKSYIDKSEDLKLFPDVAKDYWAFYEIVEATNAHDFTRGKDGVESWK